MRNTQHSYEAKRPRHLQEQPVPAIPQVDRTDADSASVEYSHYRTGLSHHRTELSEHRTSLSEYRTDLSMHRTDLSEGRTEMSMRRTGMSYQRTRLSADRTMMSIIRTALSLIGFGFTIFQFFSHLRSANLLEATSHAPRNFGTALVAIGIILLTLGIVYHVRFMLGLRHGRDEMKREALIHGESAYPVSLPLVTAILLLLLGLLAIVSMVFDIATLG